MQPLRRAVRFFFGIQAVGLLGTFSLLVGSLVALWRHTPDDEMPLVTCWVVIVSALIGFLLNTVPAIAWWKLRRGRPAARPWAIAASILNVFVLLTGIDTLEHFGRTSSWPIAAVCGAIGLLGLIGFWNREGPRKEELKPVRIPGDGTSSVRDYTSQIVSFGILSISFQLWNHWAEAHDFQAPGVAPGLLLLQLAVLLNTFFHESGHLLAGWASRMILRRFHVGPVLCAIRNGRWKIEFRVNQFYSGSVGMVTPNLKNIRSRQAFMIMGGPLASFVSGAIATTAALSAPAHAWEPYWPMLSMLASLGWSSFVTNLIPLKRSARYSDGAQLYQIVTRGEWADLHIAFAMVSSSLVTPIRPRDFDGPLLERTAGSITQGEHGLLLRLFLCQHYLDLNQIPQALAKLEAAEALYHQSTFDKPQDICAEFVFVNAFYKRDLAAAETWWQRIESLRAVEPDADFWRARAALLWLRGERKEAREAWAFGHELAQQLPASGVCETTRLCFAQLYNALEQRMPAPPPLESAALAAIHSIGAH